MDVCMPRGSRVSARVTAVVNTSQFYIRLEDKFYIQKYAKVLNKVIKNPLYNSKFYQLREGSVKVVSDLYFARGFRAKILKVFCPVKGDKLVPAAQVMLLDTGSKWCVDSSKIFEFPCLIGHWACLEPMAVECSLYDNKIDHRNELCNKLFAKAVITGTDVDIEIREIVDGKHLVDIFSQTQSMCSYLCQNAKKTNSKSSLGRQYNNQQMHWGSNNWKPVLSCFNYMLDIHQNASKKNEKSYPNIRESLLGVVILWWDGPDRFYVRPCDPVFANFAKKYQSYIDSEIDENSNQHGEDCVYEQGGFCLMKNDVNQRYGTWIRGQIELVIETQTGGFAIPLCSGNKKDLSDNGPFEAELLFEGCTNPIRGPNLEGTVYKVRSIDYGFVCLRTNLNMRPLNKAFRTVGSLAMRCSLFGIYPTGMCTSGLTNRMWTKSALNSVYTWLLERRYKKLYILIREDMAKLANRPNDSSLNTQNVRINLFCIKQLGLKTVIETNESERFESLISELINQGLATDYCDATRTSSRIFIDEDLLNTTEPAELVPIDQRLSTRFKNALQNFGSIR